jgi:hypothetical protein
VNESLPPHGSEPRLSEPLHLTPAACSAVLDHIPLTSRLSELINTLPRNINCLLSRPWHRVCQGWTVHATTTTAKECERFSKSRTTPDNAKPYRASYGCGS